MESLEQSPTPSTLPTLPASGLSVDTLLQAINAVKADVAALTTGLQSAQDRISRLETAAYTPPASPLHASRETNSVGLHVTDLSEVHQNEQSEASTSGVSHETHSSASTRSDETIYEIQRQLKPINIGMTAICDHLVRIERKIVETQDTTIHAPDTATDRDTSNKTRLSSDVAVKPSRSVTSTSLPDILPNLEPGPPLITPKVRRFVPRPIFGQPSTPRPCYRPAINDISRSPFGHYVDERSPFCQLHGVAGEGFGWTKHSSSQLKPNSLRSANDSAEAPGFLHQLYAGRNPYDQTR